MPAVQVPIVVDEVDLKMLMTHFKTDNPSYALSQALKWAATASGKYAMMRHSESGDDFIGKSEEELQDIVAYTFPEEVQERIEQLLDKKREEVITENETRELDQLIREVQLKTVEKAKAMSALKLCKEMGI